MPASSGLSAPKATMGLTLCSVKPPLHHSRVIHQSLEVDPWASFVGLYNLWREALQISKGLVCPHPTPWGFLDGEKAAQMEWEAVVGIQTLVGK